VSTKQQEQHAAFVCRKKTSRAAVFLAECGTESTQVAAYVLPLVCRQSVKLRAQYSKHPVTSPLFGYPTLDFGCPGVKPDT
jgi:hypothetical protein